jgi:hypothetical protein
MEHSQFWLDYIPGWLQELAAADNTPIYDKWKIYDAKKT